VPDLPVERYQLAVDREYSTSPGRPDPGLDLGQELRVVGRQPLHPLSGIAATKLTAVLELAGHHANHDTATRSVVNSIPRLGTQLSHSAELPTEALTPYGVIPNSFSVTSSNSQPRPTGSSYPCLTFIVAEEAAFRRPYFWKNRDCWFLQ
jgi:hypothetical protein